jgi:hypothetical protein
MTKHFGKRLGRQLIVMIEQRDEFPVASDKAAFDAADTPPRSIATSRTRGSSECRRSTDSVPAAVDPSSAMQCCQFV